jgi:hypothetical protein
MRKLLPLAALAALAATALIATPASASFDSHFTVRGHDYKEHSIGSHRISFSQKLRKHGERVGTATGRCHHLRRESKCHVNYFLNGKVGGRGHIHAFGRYGKGLDRFNVSGGTAAFDGVAGKIIFSHNLLRSQFHLVS